MVCGGFSNKVPQNTAMTEAGQCCCVKYKVQDDMEVNRRHRLKKKKKPTKAAACLFFQTLQRMPEYNCKRSMI